VQHSINNLHQGLRAFLRLNTFLGLVLIGLMWAGIVYHLSVEERNAVEAARQNTSNLARVFEEHIARAVEEVDKILLSLRTAHTKNPGRFDVEAARIYLSELILQIGEIGPDGFLKPGTVELPPDTHIDLSDREHFRVHLNTDKDDLFISKPVIGRTTGKPSIQLSRRLYNPDGSFDGVIVASIDQSNLLRFYDSIDVGKDGVIAIVGLDRIIRASRGYKNVTLDVSFEGATLSEKLKESPTGFYVSRGLIVDGIRRMISYRKIGSLPLIVLVGLAEHEVLASYWRNRSVRYSAAAILTVIILIGVGFGAVRNQKLIETTSEIERAREDLTRLNQGLETRVAERTAELAQEMRRREEAQMALAQIQKMDAVGRLTAGVAHDFNNLLAVIKGSLEFVEGAAARGLPAEPELIDAATRATRRGGELVQRLLAFSRQTPLRNEPTMVDQLVLDTLRMLQRTLGSHINIVTHLNATAASVSVDRSQLANALVNLALNARDAMPDGGEITIVTTCRTSPWAATEGPKRWPTGEEVCITISDTGVGMTEEVRSRAIEPFFTTKKDGLGSGLGLSMVQGFAEQSGGHVEITSEVGSGTSISIHLPKIDMASHAADGEATVSGAATGNERTVLLVEDDPDVRVVMAAQLKQLGYKVHAVTNGNEAIDLIESPATIDITLTDIVLPGGVNGVTLLTEALRMRPKMGVLCMSSYDPTQKHRQWLMVQNIEFLEKPFSRARLAQALDHVIAK
jgi:signal transduction histidine kinase